MAVFLKARLARVPAAYCTCCRAHNSSLTTSTSQPVTAFTAPSPGPLPRAATPSAAAPTPACAPQRVTNRARLSDPATVSDRTMCVRCFVLSCGIALDASVCGRLCAFRCYRLVCRVCCESLSMSVRSLHPVSLRVVCPCAITCRCPTRACALAYMLCDGSEQVCAMRSP